MKTMLLWDGNRVEWGMRGLSKMIESPMSGLGCVSYTPAICIYQVYTFIKTQQMVHMKSVYFTVYNVCFNKKNSKSKFKWITLGGIHPSVWSSHVLAFTYDIVIFINMSISPPYWAEAVTSIPALSCHTQTITALSQGRCWISKEKRYSFFICKLFTILLINEQFSAWTPWGSFALFLEQQYINFSKFLKALWTLNQSALGPNARWAS